MSGYAPTVDEKNPFAPEVERVPFLLMLDALSFESLTDDARERAEFLCELCWTEAIDALWSWEGTPIAGDIPQAELRPVKNGHRSVGLVGEPPGGFIGGVYEWSQFSELCDQYGYEGAERDWFIYYASLSHFHRHSKRHYIVTADERLLAESEEESGFFRRGQHRFIPVGHALFLAGLVMKAHGEVFYESPQPGYTIRTFSHSMYEWLAMDLIASRRRLFDCMKREGEEQRDFYRSEREALVESVFDRVGDILHARDRIALVNGRHQDAGTLNENRYDLGSMIGSAAGVFDTIAVLAHIAFPFELNPKAGDAAISLRRSDFRKGLKGAGASRLAAKASQMAPLLNFIWGLRNPLFHREGLPGYTVHVLGSAGRESQESQITLSTKQVELLKELCGHRGESPKLWGLNDREAKGIDPSVEPFPFGLRLSLITIEAVDELVSAFADDRGATYLETSWTPEQHKMLRRFRWLSGLPQADSVVGAGNSQLP